MTNGALKPPETGRPWPEVPPSAPTVPQTILESSGFMCLIDLYIFCTSLGYFGGVCSPGPTPGLEQRVEEPEKQTEGADVGALLKGV